MTPMRDLKMQQHHSEVVNLNGWEPDDEFPIGPMGAKPKRIFICPTPAPQKFLIGGHRYLFKEPEPPHTMQVWSEVIAYELSRHVRVPVPPAFLATAPRNGSPGVLVEFFYGHRDRPPVRFIHGIERLQALGFPVDHRRGSLKDNLTVCRRQKIADWRFWWAETIAFDTLIGNTDRHSENWGFIASTQADGALAFSMAPAFDNGTSLGYLVREADLVRYQQPATLKRFLKHGSHHCGWISSDVGSAQHIELCRRYGTHVNDTKPTMKRVMDISNTQIEGLLSWCRGFDYSLPFSADRAVFVGAQLRARRDALLDALLGEDK